MRRRLCTALLLICLVLFLMPARAEAVQPWSREHPEILYPEHLHSAAAVLVDGETGERLFDKNADDRMYPASTTKIMTLLLALESDISLEDRVTIPAEAGDIPKKSSTVPVHPGETMPFKDLLYGFMMKSGNDGANAIAVLVSGSIEAFVARMNERAAALGCADTHFVNAHGYHDKDHYSTAADLARIAMEAMKNEEFRRIVATSSYTMAATEQRGELKITNRTELINPGSRYYYPDAVGIKTGYHSKAGQCFVGAAVRGGKLLISVALNSEGSDETLKWYDTAMLFEYGYTLYEDVSFSELAGLIPADLAVASVSDAAEDDPEGGRVALKLADVSAPEAKVPVRKRQGSGAEAMRQLWESAEIRLDAEITAPVAAGQALGSASFALPDGETVTASLVAVRDVAPKPTPTPIPTPTLAPVTPEPTATAAPVVQEESGGTGRLEKVLLALAAVAAVATGTLIALQIRENARRKRRHRKKKRVQR